MRRRDLETGMLVEVAYRRDFDLPVAMVLDSERPWAHVDSGKPGGRGSRFVPAEAGNGVPVAVLSFEGRWHPDVVQLDKIRSRWDEPLPGVGVEVCRSFIDSLLSGVLHEWELEGSSQPALA